MQSSLARFDLPAVIMILSPLSSTVIGIVIEVKSLKIFDSQRTMYLLFKQVFQMSSAAEYTFLNPSIETFDD